MAPAGRGRLTLVLPGYSPLAATPGQDLAPALRKLLARATWTATPQTTTQYLLQAFGFAPDTALAALLARADLDVSNGGWLRADPVHFRADAKLVMLMAPAVDELDATDADALLAELRNRVPEGEWRRGGDPRRWYVRLPNLDCTPVLGPAWLHGRSLTPFFPQDAAHRRWRQCMTETQMVMHEATVNAARATPLNALWIWGAGAAPGAGQARIAACVGHDLLLAGAAAWTGVTRQSTSDVASLRTALAQGDVLVLAGTPYGAIDEPASTPLVAANVVASLVWPLLLTGEAGEFAIVGERTGGSLTRSARWRLWQNSVAGSFGDPHALPAA